MTVINIGAFEIGPTAPCFLVAEIGINHNGDLNLAKKTIDAACEAGADAVKFQTYKTEDFISNRDLTYTYVRDGKTVTESQYDMFKRCELTKGALVELKSYCDQQGIIFHGTPTSASGIKDLITIGAKVLKNGSDYLTHLPLIKAMGQTGLPTVISTGMATLAEIDDAVRTFRETGNEQLILLHCISAYPTPPETVNLHQIPAMQAVFNCKVGFSDHTEGNTAAIGAVILGACWIEKHFTLNKSLPGPDHKFSADPSEFKSLVNAVRTIEKNLGNSTVTPVPSEQQGKQDFRLSCVAAKDLPASHALTDTDIVFRRPGTGLPPKRFEVLKRRQLKEAVTKGHIFKFEDFV